MTIYPTIRSLQIEYSVTVKRGVSNTYLIFAIRRFHLPTMNLDLRRPTCLYRIIATNHGTHLRPILPRSIPLAMLRALQRQPMNLKALRAGVLDKGADKSTGDEYDDHKDDDLCP